MPVITLFNHRNEFVRRLEVAFVPVGAPDVLIWDLMGHFGNAMLYPTMDMPFDPIIIVIS